MRTSLLVSTLLALLVACKGKSEPSPTSTAPSAGSGSGSATSSGSAGSTGSGSAVAPTDKPMTPVNDQAALVLGHNNFAVELYNKLPAGNVAISPASITIAMAMTWAGAKGQTADEISKTMHFAEIAHGDPPAVLSHWGDVAKQLVDPKRPYTLRLANRLFVDKHRELDTVFFDINMKTFGARTDAFDFQTAPDDARQKINTWVAQATEQKIKNLLPPPAITPATRLVVVNAIYFLASWADPFSKGATSPQPFHVSATETKQVPTMYRQGSYRFAHDKGATLLELPYKGGDVHKGADVSMYILLPDAPDGLPAVEANLAETLRALQGRLAWAQISVYLPKFTIDPAEPLDLEKQLGALGIKQAFTPSADFTGISKDTKEPLFISAVLHKAFIKVDEQGTEAAAATAVTLRAGGAPGVPVLFTADHPFVFLIVDRATSLILFIGRVADPS